MFISEGTLFKIIIILIDLISAWIGGFLPLYFISTNINISYQHILSFINSASVKNFLFHFYFIKIVIFKGWFFYFYILSTFITFSYQTSYSNFT